MHRLVVCGETVQPPVHGSETTGQSVDTVRPDRSVRELNRKFIVLPGVSHIYGAIGSLIFRCNAFIFEP